VCAGPLPDTHQLARAARIDAPVARTVRARHLPDPRVDAEPAQRARHPFRGAREARADARAFVALRRAPCERDRLAGEDGRRAAREPKRRIEALAARGSYRA
jgi:hypothetical protein